MACYQPNTGPRSAGVKRRRSDSSERPHEMACIEDARQSSSQTARTAPREALSPERTPSPNEDQEPIAYWSQHHRWPHQFFEAYDSMANILAQKRSASSRSSKISDPASVPLTASSITPSDQKPREEKSADYKHPGYATVLATKGIFMVKSEAGIAKSGRTLCQNLLANDQTVPSDSLFDDDLFEKTCQMVQSRNEAKVIQDITRLIVPSAQELAIRSAGQLKGLIESVNEGWNNCIPIMKTRPQPDYAVGFRREAFTQAQLDRMQPIVGDLMDRSYFMATYYMYFPFLTCEVKCGAAALDVADRQNAHSMAVALRAVVELFRALNREKELHREILAFSISHDHRTVRLYGHYAEIVGPDPKYYRHAIHTFDFTALEGKEKWTAYKFTKNIYETWAPMHFQRICSVIDALPPDISFAMSESELHFTEQLEVLQDVNIASSSGGSRSVRAQDTETSAVDNPSSTPSTLFDGVFKKPRRDPDQTACEHQYR